MITSIHTISIYVSDQDRALEFYRDALGFDVITDDRSIPGYRWLTLAPKGSQTSFQIFHVTPDRTDEAAKMGTHTGIVLYTDAIHADHDKMKAHGVKITEALRQEMWGWEMQFADPDGNTFELVQPAAR